MVLYPKFCAGAEKAFPTIPLDGPLIYPRGRGEGEAAPAARVPQGLGDNELGEDWHNDTAVMEELRHADEVREAQGPSSAMATDDPDEEQEQEGASEEVAAQMATDHPQGDQKAASEDDQAAPTAKDPAARESDARGAEQVAQQRVTAAGLESQKPAATK